MNWQIFLSFSGIDFLHQNSILVLHLPTIIYSPISTTFASNSNHLHTNQETVVKIRVKTHRFTKQSFNINSRFPQEEKRGIFSKSSAIRRFRALQNRTRIFENVAKILRHPSHHFANFDHDRWTHSCHCIHKCTDVFGNGVHCTNQRKIGVKCRK